MLEKTTEIPQKQRVYASVRHPTINAAIKSLYSFIEKDQAIARLEQLKNDFVTSKQANVPMDSHSVILWVCGYAISKKEDEAGYKGNFACFSVAKKENGKFTIKTVKVESELGFHPQKIRVKRTHPDWGNPILRDIQKKRIYFSLEEATHELVRLHEDFPQVSIPLDGGLLIIIYGKDLGKDGMRTQKYRFKIRKLADDTFTIDYKENLPVQSPKRTQPRNTEGFFTQKEKVRKLIKNKKGAANILGKPNKKQDDAIH